jgi:Fusaric acid resistance protein-like
MNCLYSTDSSGRRRLDPQRYCSGVITNQTLDWTLLMIVPALYHHWNMETPIPAPAVSNHFLTDSTVFQWQNQTLRADLILILPVALCLGIGIAVGHPVAGMLAAGGAVNTGFGQKHRIDDSYLLPMIFVTFGMAFSGFFGVLIGHENLLLVAMAALWGFGYGMLTARPEGYGWVGQQCVITFLVASAFPASPVAAVDRGLLLFAGGALQLFLSSILFHLFGDLRRHLFQLTRYLREEQLALRAALFETADSVRQQKFVNSVLPYALRIAATIGIATEIYRRLQYPSGYWIPMTALLVLKPGLTDTVSRAIARMLGTWCGAIAVSFFLAHMQPSHIALAAGTILFAWLAYGFLNVNYALFTTAITGYIVCLLALNEVPGPTTAKHRTFCTALGGAIALCLRLIVISYKRRHWLRAAAELRRAVFPIRS